MCVFGILKLDKELNLHIMDKPIAFISGNMSDGLDELKNMVYGKIKELSIMGVLRGWQLYVFTLVFFILLDKNDWIFLNIN